MSALYDAEEADQEAAERLRVAEWADDHQDPLTAALQRAEHAEAMAEAEAEVERLASERDRIGHKLTERTAERDAALALHKALREDVATMPLLRGHASLVRQTILARDVARTKGAKP